MFKNDAFVKSELIIYQLLLVFALLVLLFSTPDSPPLGNDNYRLDSSISTWLLIAGILSTEPA